MTTRTFIGANNTYYAVAADWSPGDAYPANGDTAVMNGVSVKIAGSGLALTNVTWNLTNATVSGMGVTSQATPAMQTLGSFTVNLSGTNTLPLNAYLNAINATIQSTTVFNQAPSGVTTLNGDLLVQTGTMSLTGGTFNLLGGLESEGTVILNTNMVEGYVNGQPTGVLEVVNGGSIELASGSNSAFIGFAGGLVQIDSSASFNGIVSGLSSPQIQSKLVFKNQNYSSFTYDGATVTIGPYTFSDTDGTFYPLVLSHVGNDTVLGPACFLAGTSIMTAAGPIPVEDLAIGDRVVTRSGVNRPIKWMGRRSYTRRFVQIHRHLRPVLFQAGSLGHDLPHRDLSVSPDHAMYLDGYLVPAWVLANGATIVPWVPAEDVRYYHIELDSHDIIFAEGAATETFLDDESRHIFHNEAEFYALYPGPQPFLRFCAPRIEHGFEIEAIRRSLPCRAAAAA